MSSKRRLIVSNMMSLDGFFEGPNRELDWHIADAEFIAYAADMLRSSDTIVFGRTTYELMAGYWPAAPKDDVAEKMNGLPKLVFSKTLPAADWNNTRLARGDAGEELARMKQQPGKDIVILGSAKLASSLLRKGLIDEYRVILNPILLGRGNLLFGDVGDKVRLKLRKTQPLQSGVVVLYYDRAP